MKQRLWSLVVVGILISSGGCAALYPTPGGEPEPLTYNAVTAIDPWTDFAGREGQAISTRTYRINTTMADGVVLRRFPNFVERSIDHYTTSLGQLPEPRRPLETYLMASRTQWADATRVLTGPQADLYLQIPRGGYAFSAKGVYYDIGPADTFSIAAHEGWHQYRQSAFRQAMPSWLEEGIACYMEGYRWSPEQPNLPEFLPWRNQERFDRLRELVRAGRQMSVTELLVSRPQDLIQEAGDGTLDFYAQVWAMAHFLREGEGGVYADALTRLLNDAAAGRMTLVLRDFLIERGERASAAGAAVAVFRAYFNDDLEQADQEYQRFLNQVTVTGAGEAINAGRSPLE